MGWGPGWPLARAGMAVGLLGGSFDPPHAGHVHLTREALKRLGLDQVWWLVTPGNPLKPHGPAPLGERLARSRQLMRHPRVRITDLEHRMGTRYTADTLAALQARYPGVRFVWLMGADNLAGLHRWDDWTEIPARMPMGIIARPGNRLSAGLSPAARLFGAARVRPQAAHALARMAPPAWAFLNLPMRGESSSALRRAGAWSGT